MKQFMAWILVVSLLPMSVHSAASKKGASLQPTGFDAETSATIAAWVFNQAKSPEGLLQMIGKVASAPEVTGLREVFASSGQDLKTPFPKATASGNKVTFAKSKLKMEFREDGKVVVAGRVLSVRANEGLDSMAKRNLGRPQASLFLLEALFPASHAYESMGRDLARTAMLIVAAAVVVGGAIVMGANWIFSDSAKVECQDKSMFRVRSSSGESMALKAPLTIGSVTLTECNAQTSASLLDFLKKHGAVQLRSSGAPPPASGPGQN